MRTLGALPGSRGISLLQDRFGAAFLRRVAVYPYSAPRFVNYNEGAIRMHNFRAAGALMAATALLASPAFAQDSDTATASGSATLVEPLQITKDTDLEFGQVIKPVTGTGTITMGSGSNTVSGTDGAGTLGGITPSRATFSITGEDGESVSVQVPTSFTMTDGTTNLIVTLAADNGGTQTLTGGELDLAVGGSFPLPASADAGAYTGNFTVQVDYN